MVSEDWRYRMLTPPKGDAGGVPLNADGTQACRRMGLFEGCGAGEACRAYGAAGLMRLPGRLHITWQDERTLKVETDAGTQTRLLRFGGGAAAGGAERTWQGNSAAAWDAVQGGDGAPRWGSLRVVTTHLRPGYLRKNGVPYSENTVLTEYCDLQSGPKELDLDHDHYHRQRSAVPHAGVHHQHGFQERAQRREVETDAVHRRLILAPADRLRLPAAL